MGTRRVTDRHVSTVSHGGRSNRRLTSNPACYDRTRVSSSSRYSPPRYGFVRRLRKFWSVYREARSLGFTVFGAWRAARKSS
jgi:hypothetical protein